MIHYRIIATTWFVAGMIGLCLSGIEFIHSVGGAERFAGGSLFGGYVDLGYFIIVVLTALLLLRPRRWVRVLAGLVAMPVWTICGSLLVVVGSHLGSVLLVENCLAIVLAAYAIAVCWFVRPMTT